MDANYHISKLVVCYAGRAQFDYNLPSLQTTLLTLTEKNLEVSL